MFSQMIRIWKETDLYYAFILFQEIAVPQMQRTCLLVKLVRIY